MSWPLNSDYSYWIYKQLEPADIIITGNHKRYHELRKEYVMPKVAPDTRTPEQIEDAEDEYLERHGVPVKLRNK